ncbi:hypothetical protein AAFF_G00231430 [Aldrovandia affinis]|uniref:Uncharacterized protein n=1 Tax=Aldrovandia affinis TaxID=143900 RepID=A0AAD7RF46_9TELE|nr:hypothetical protein AAFF_G00231430 [Aldrovandia affinis]
MGYGEFGVQGVWKFADSLSSGCRSFLRPAWGASSQLQGSCPSVWGPPRSATPSAPFGVRKGSLCPPVQYGYPYSAQGAAPTGHGQTGALAPAPPSNPSPLPGLHSGALHKSPSTDPGPNLRPT